MICFADITQLLTVNRVTHARRRFKLDAKSSDQEVIYVVWGCTGNERQLLSCPQTPTSQSSCNRTETGVYCYGKLELS